MPPSITKPHAKMLDKPDMSLEHGSGFVSSKPP